MRPMTPLPSRDPRPLEPQRTKLEDHVQEIGMSIILGALALMVIGLIVAVVLAIVIGLMYHTRETLLIFMVLFIAYYIGHRIYTWIEAEDERV